MSMTPEEIQALLSGQITPDQLAAQQQQSQIDPNDPYANRLAYLQNADPLANASQTAADLWGQIGGQNVLPKYQEQNFKALLSTVLGAQGGQQKDIYNAQVGQQNFGLKQAQQDIKNEQAARGGLSPEADFQTLQTFNGPEGLKALYDAWDSGDSAKQAAAAAAVAQELGYGNDKNGLPIWANDPAAHQRVGDVIHHALGVRDQQTQQAQQVRQTQDWANLPANDRAKQVWFNLIGKPQPGAAHPAGWDYGDWQSPVQATARRTSAQGPARNQWSQAYRGEQNPQQSDVAYLLGGLESLGGSANKALGGIWNRLTKHQKLSESPVGRTFRSQ